MHCLVSVIYDREKLNVKSPKQTFLTRLVKRSIGLRTMIPMFYSQLRH